jgi:dihydrolipoamide dehydrogenase
MTYYDTVIIGGGPAGYSCAIKASQLGAKVCLIEMNGLGGTCTQRGCIPTKFLHSVGDLLRKTRELARSRIVTPTSVLDIDYNALKSRMDSTVSRLSSGIGLLLKKNNVNVIAGRARISSRNSVQVDVKKQIDTRTIVIASGTHPVCIKGYDFNEKILSTSTILKEKLSPRSIAIVGGGYSGCEFAAILNAFGYDVTLIEEQKNLIPKHTSEIGEIVEKYLRLDGVNVITGQRLERFSDSCDCVFTKDQRIDVEQILVCTGRKPNIDSDELENIGVKFDLRNGIIIDDRTLTSTDNIYAIGDITGKFEVAHVAAKQGEVAALNIMGIDARIDYHHIPICIFTYPEVAFVGDLGRKVQKSESQFAANAKANCLRETRGSLRIFQHNGLIVGASIIGPHAGELIAEATLAIRMGLKVSDITQTVHAHPTLNESYIDTAANRSGLIGQTA